MGILANTIYNTCMAHDNATHTFKSFPSLYWYHVHISLLHANIFDHFEPEAPLEIVFLA